MNAAGVRAALRIARRDALRAKGRSALVVAMVGVPMLGLAFADVAVRTSHLPPAVRAARDLGATDLVAEVVEPFHPIAQVGLDGWADAGTAGAEPVRPGGQRLVPDPATVLPPGSRVLPWSQWYAVRVRAAHRVALVIADRTDLADPAAAGLVRLRAGTFPRAGEAAVTPRLAARLGLRLGDEVTVAGTRARVTAVVVRPSDLREERVYLPGASGPLNTKGAEVVRWGVTLPPGARDVDQVAALNALGIQVRPRTWYFDPPPQPVRGGPVDAESIGVTVVVVGLATLEVVLLAGTAFAVGARRRRRELALVAAAGGSRADVRRIVLAGGVVLGTVAGTLGVGLAALAVFLGRPWLERLAGSELGPLSLRPLELAAVVAAGAGTALLATLLPARAAARQPVVAALTGRRGEVRTPRRVPVVALLAVAGGALGLLV
ncbi:MAG TPA: FtsX-like permease family protein, partial [Mycobacteriales bacterium]|nr:FtsX-like permease family protein [Mycobacteriales bacterium]